MSKITGSDSRSGDHRNVTATDYAEKRGLDINLLSSSKDNVIIDKASASITYFGFSVPGSLSSDAAWRVLRKEVVSDTITEFKYAGGNDAYDNVWNDRASLSYS